MHVRARAAASPRTSPQYLVQWQIKHPRVGGGAARGAPDARARAEGRGRITHGSGLKDTVPRSGARRRVKAQAGVARPFPVFLGPQKTEPVGNPV